MEMFHAYSDEESDDEWFFESIKRYDDLLMYDVQGQVSCMCFCDDTTLILAVSRDTVNEVWEVKVPDKLVAGKNAGLFKNRDFTLVAAGYTSNPVGEVVWTGGGVVTSGPAGVELYTKDATDVMNLASSLRSGVKNASLATSGSTVFSGESLSNITSSDLTSYLTKSFSVESNDSDNKHKISRMSVIHDCLFVGLSERGTVLVYDTKAGSLGYSVESSELCSGSGRWSMDVSQDGNTVVLANSAGVVSVHDTRNLSQPLFTWTHDTQAELSSSPEIHISPTGLQLSLSGSGKHVQVIDCKHGVDSNRTVFVHDGHRSHQAKRVVHHLWHPTQEKLLFSADDDSKVQAWKYR